MYNAMNTITWYKAVEVASHVPGIIAINITERLRFVHISPNVLWTRFWQQVIQLCSCSQFDMLVLYSGNLLPVQWTKQEVCGCPLEYPTSLEDRTIVKLSPAYTQVCLGMCGYADIQYVLCVYWFLQHITQEILTWKHQSVWAGTQQCLN
jgi:hypothetical protein